jgi:hypothetical protein
MKQPHQSFQRRRQPALARLMTHAAVLLVLGLAIGLTTVTASADARPDTPGPVSQTEQVNAPQAPADVELRVGETATLDGGALLVTLAEVTEDSRCPRNVMCVWSGRAVVTLHVVVDGTDHGDVPATMYPTPRNQPSPQLDATVDRYVLSLTGLQPYPDTSQTQPVERVATVHVAPATP